MIKDQISNNKIRQFFLLSIILILLFSIFYNLREYAPSILGAITLYVVCRNFNFYLIEKRKWKSWISAIFLIIITILIIVVPIYFLIDSLVLRILDSKSYVQNVVKYAESTHIYILETINIDISKSFDIKKIGEQVSKYASLFLSGSISIFTKILFSYFILYFLLTNSKFLENKAYLIIPLKKSNVEKLGNKLQRMILANVIGIPIVAIGQGFTLLIGYLLFNVSSPIFLFVLTIVASVIPIVGGSIVYIPVVLTLLVDNNIVGAVGILIFGIISGIVDNIFRFTFLKKVENIHPLNSVFGIILGLNLFGFIGIIFGPIIVSIAILLVEIYHSEFSHNESNR